MTEDLIQAAIADGKFSPSRAAHYRRVLESDPATGQAIIAALEPARPPGLPSAGSDPEDAYPKSWLPEDLPERVRGPVTLEDPSMAGANGAGFPADRARQQRLDHDMARYGRVGRGG